MQQSKMHESHADVKHSHHISEMDNKPYEYQEYPKVVQAGDKEITVHSAEEEAAL